MVSLVGLRVALPTLLERAAAYASREWVGLPVRVEIAEISLLSGDLVLKDVTIGAKPDDVSSIDAALELPPIDPATALLHLERVSTHLSWTDLREGSIRLMELELVSPSVRLVRESDGAIDPLRHARPLAPESPEEPDDDEASEPMPFLVDHFALSAPELVIVDPPSGKNLVEFSLEKFELVEVSAVGSQFALGGVGIEGPALRVRRELLLAEPAAGKPKPKPTEKVPAKSPATDEGVAKPASETATEPAIEAATEAATEPGAAPIAKATDKTQPDVASAGAAAEDPANAEAKGQNADPRVVADAKAIPESPAAANAESEPSGYRIEKIEIARAMFTLVTQKGPLEVALGLKASGITADEGVRFPLDLQLEIGKGKIAIAGDVGVLPPSYTGKLNWNGLPFPPLLLASQPELADWLRSADSTGSLQIDADVAGTKGAPSLSLSGEITVDALDLADPSGEAVGLGWKRLEIKIAEVFVPLPDQGKAPGTTKLDMKLVRLVEPKIRYTHPSSSLAALSGGSATSADSNSAGGKKVEESPKDVAVESPQEGAAKSPEPVEGKGALDVRIARLELTAGDLAVVDNTVSPSVTSTVRDLEFSATSLRFPETAAKEIKLRALLPEGSTLSVDGELNPGLNGDFKISLKKLNLPMLSPYASAAGTSLDAGTASLETNLKLRGAKIQVDNKLLLRKFGVSLQHPETFDKEFGVPIDLALALLRDPAGDISLSIPLKIDEKGTQVSMSAIVASALKAALIGAVTAPLKMLGAAFGGDDKDGSDGGFGLAPISSVPGSSELGSDAQARAKGLAKLLTQRPTMKVLLRGRTGSEDIRPVAEAILAEDVASGKGLPDVDGSGFLARRRIGKALEVRLKDPSSSEVASLSQEDRELFERYAKAVKIPPARMDALAIARAEAFRALLIAESVPPERVSVEKPESAEDPGVALAFGAN